jgi:glycosyltransferase involved in cell wall biosynthesis
MKPLEDVSVRGGSRRPRPLTIVVHAASLRYSGANHVARSVIRSLGKSDEVTRVHALVPAGRGFEELACDKVVLKFVPHLMQHSAAIAIWNVMLKQIVKHIRPDATLNLANIAVPGIENQFVLLHWPHALHMTPDVARRLPRAEYWLTQIKLFAFAKGLRHARRYFVQTRAAQQAMADRYGVEALLMPNAVDTTLDIGQASHPRRSGRRRVLVFSHFYPHKNLEIIETLARRVAALNLPYTFVLTINPSGSGKAQAFLGRLGWAIESGIVENRGVVPPEDIPALYHDSDVLLLPTLLESFSTTYAEAMRFGVPIVTSDREFARTVCGDAALYIDALSADSIVAALDRLFASSDLSRRLVEAGRAILASMPDWDAITEKLLHDIRDDLAAGHRV